MKQSIWLLALLLFSASKLHAQRDTLDPFERMEENSNEVFDEFRENSERSFQQFKADEKQWHLTTTGEAVSDYTKIGEESQEEAKKDRSKPDATKADPQDGGSDLPEEEASPAEPLEPGGESQQTIPEVPEENTEKDATPEKPDRKPLEPKMYMPLGKPLKRYKKITSEFGYRMHPIHHKRLFHSGIDIAADKGRKIYATASGKVIKSELSPSYGYFVLLQHKNTYRTTYAHCSKLLVDEGQVISRGDAIGLVGQTGYATGDHLHYEVIKNRKKVDPRNYF